MSQVYDGVDKEFPLTRVVELTGLYAELGAVFNAFSLHETSDPKVASGIEKVGQALDSSYLASNALVRVDGIAVELIPVRSYGKWRKESPTNCTNTYSFPTPPRYLIYGRAEPNQDAP